MNSSIYLFLNWIGGISASTYYHLQSPFAAQEIVKDFGEAKMYIRRGTSDMFIAREMFVRHIYGKPATGIVLDFGANIGAYSVYAAKSASKVYAFEPERTNNEQCRKNIALNGLTNVTVFKNAVGGENGKAHLSTMSSNTGAHSIAAKLSSKAEEVEVVTLASALALCGADHVDLLKVDIEGSEYDLFERAPIEVLRRIERIEMEVHPVPGKNAERLYERLRSAGFTVSRRHSPFSWLGYDVVTAVLAGSFKRARVGCQALMGAIA